MKRGLRSRRQGYLWILSLVVVGSMICSVLVMIRPPRTAPTPIPRPTRLIPTWTPTPRPTVTLTPTRSRETKTPTRLPASPTAFQHSQAEPTLTRKPAPQPAQTDPCHA